MLLCRLVSALVFCAALVSAQPSADSIAARLEAAAADADRAAILAERPDLRGEVLKIVSAHATAAFAKPDYDQALQDYHAVLAIHIANSDPIEIARAYRRISQCLYRKNELRAAVEYGEKSLDLSLKIDDKASIAESYGQLVGSYIFMGRLDDARQMAAKAHEGFLELGDKHRAAGSLINLAFIAGEKGDETEKAALLRQAILACEEGGFDDYLGPALNNLAVLYHDQGDYERSLVYLRRAGELLDRQPSPDPIHISGLHSNTAIMLAQLGRDKEAFAEYDEAEAVARKANLHEQVIHVRSNRASLYRTTGNSAKALEEMREVAAFYETSAVRIDALRSLGEYVQTLLAAGDAKEAVRVGEKYIDEARSIGGPDLLWYALWPLADAYLATHDREKARAIFLEAIAAVESVKLAGGEDEKDNFFHEKTFPYHGMVSLLLEENRPFEALQFAERAKARLLLDVLRGGRAEIARALTDAEKQRERDLASAVAKIDAQIARAPSQPGALLAQRDKSIVDLENFRQSLYAAHPGLQMRRAEFSPLTTAQLSNLLSDSRTALLEYTVTKSAVYLFVITRGASEPRVAAFSLRDPSSLASLIEKFRSQLAARDLDYRATAKLLYDRALGPASAAIANKQRIVIVPDGPLWNLPFQALINHQDRYLLEQSALFYAPSLAAAVEMRNITRRPSPQSRTLLALGGPASIPGALPALPESIREVRRIGEIYGSPHVSILTGSQAMKDRWKSAAPDYRILHLATHGVLNANNPLYSYLVMSAPPGAKEESVLTAREILALDLQADITVLSACETARGKYRSGEGLIGMSWAFLVAGTPTTVVSQWKVDSSSTSQLMVAFHRNLKASNAAPLNGRAEALRAAVLDLLHTPAYRHPFYWAGFVMIGNGY